MYILENVKDGSIFGAKTYSIKSQFASESSAKAAMTRYAKQFTDNPYGRIVFNRDDYKVSLMLDYVEPQVTQTKRMPGTGETVTYTIGINSVGTCVDPSTETYWSM
ncbi:MAG: hypothetical protein CMO97_02290 [Woeseia sp.]|nr:hypothetical protein [Woeseia sp.]|tara:strand:+ start:285 stop:602 length:318 start_codon:yes stop_codon:yes gene_type:complete